MRIKRLVLENFRGFQKASVDFPEGNVAVFFGWNGAGKTAVLDALAIVLGEVLAFSLDDTTGLFDDDILDGEGEAIITADIDGDLEGNVRRTIKRIKNENPIGRTVKDWKNFFGEKIKILPIVAYYRVNRELHIAQVSSLSINQVVQKAGSRGYAYMTALNTLTGTFDDFVEWFRHEEDIENQQKIETKNFNHEIQGLKTIRQAISVFLSKMDMNFSKIKVNRQYNGEMDFSRPSRSSELYIKKAEKDLKLSQLSSGERSLILLVADIARRAGILNPQLPDPLQGSGVVLIDEIELHLHPKWQRAVIPALQATFPNIQFIIATHSPQVLSEVENGGVFEIENFQIHPRSTYGRDNNWLLHVIMEDDERPEDVQHDLEKYFALLRSGQLDAAARLRQQIEEKIGADEPEFVKADILLRRKERALAS